MEHWVSYRNYEIWNKFSGENIERVRRKIVNISCMNLKNSIFIQEANLPILIIFSSIEVLCQFWETVYLTIHHNGQWVNRKEYQLSISTNWKQMYKNINSISESSSNSCNITDSCVILIQIFNSCCFFTGNSVN